MKKIILLLVLFFNIVPCVKNGEFCIFNVEKVAAQYGCPKDASDPGVNSSGGGFFQWLGTALNNAANTIGTGLCNIASAFGSIGNAIGTFASNVAVFFSNGGGSSGEDYGAESNAWDNLADIPDLSDSNWPPELDDISEGDHYSYDMTLAYASFINPPTNPPSPKDTVQPVKKPCATIDTAAYKRDTAATRILDDLDKTPEMKKIRDSLSDNHERSLSAYESTGSFKVMPGSTFTGNSNSVGQKIRDSATNISANVFVHSHPDSVDAFPDCADLFNLIQNQLYNANGLKHSFIIAKNPVVDLAMVIYNPNWAYGFLNLFNPNDAVLFDTTNGIKSNPQWADYINPLTTNKLSLSEEFDNARKLLYRNHYPEKLLATYAQAYMFERYNMGVKMLIKVDGKMKELSVNVTRNSNGKLKNLTISICE